ncbi:Uncharacterized protein K02A2.6 [Paramuricea clavata]|uniref:Uncharacterized protein K02A2.6 n=1 Tax=Paramuricea clavata TaxID=317549 RepID=A0A7D9E9F9_PARCT|nr:Uncharacterized protein K02A2.6 [Paramuricea clavata]
MTTWKSSEFSKTYVVEKRLVTQYLEHLRELERRKKKREDSRKCANLEEKRKTFEDYIWKAIYREGKIKKLKVVVLDMYISTRNLKQSKGALKQEKVDIVSLDIAKSLVPDNRQLSEVDRDSNNQDSGDDDVVVQEIGSDEDDIDSDDDEGQIYEGDAGEEEEEEENISNLLQTTRSGRFQMMYYLMHV